MKYGAIPEGPLEALALKLGKVPLPLLDTLFALIKCRSLMAAVKLGVAEGLRGGWQTPGELAAKLRLDAGTLELLLRALAVADYVEADDGRYRLSRLGQKTLLDGAGTELTSYIAWNYVQWEMMAQMDQLLATGRGVDFHQHMKDDADWARYQKAMLELARFQAPVLSSRVPVRRGAERLLDVGGSHGLLGAAICRRHPPMKSTVLDLPQAVPHARELARREGHADLLTYREGDLVAEAWGEGHDVVLLSSILHHFQPEEIRALLQKARGALRPGGTVAIWDIEAPERSSRPSAGDIAAFFFRLTSTAGAYSGKAYAGWLGEAGFTEVRTKRPRLTPGTVLVTGRLR